jgi:hypothetical protein
MKICANQQAVARHTGLKEERFLAGDDRPCRRFEEEKTAA